MSNVWSMLDNIGDSINPIVVKELRQAVQGRFVTGALLLLLLVQLVMIAFALLVEQNTTLDAGQTLFMWLLGVLLFVSLFFIPVYTGGRLAAERADNNVDLLFITTLSPVSIIWGKMLAGLIITLLIYSACLPFMTFTYFLRGIDIPSILVVLILTVAIVTTFIQIGVFLACLPVGKVFRALIGLGAFGSLFITFGSTMGMCYGILSSGVGSMLGTWEFWGPATMVIVFFLVGIGLFFVLSVAVVSPPASNRAFPVRVYLVAVWIITGITLGGSAIQTNSFEPIAAWIGICTGVAGLALISSVCERETLTRRIRRTIPTNPISRIVAFFFYSGSANGLIWSLAFMGITLLIGATLAETITRFKDRGDLDKAILMGFGTTMYFFNYSMTALLIRRLLPGDKVKPFLTWIFVVILMALGSAVPPILAFLISFESADTTWLLLNPYAFVIDSAGKSQWLFFFVVSIWGLAVLGVHLKWLLTQIRNFTPLTPAPVSE